LFSVVCGVAHASCPRGRRTSPTHGSRHSRSARLDHDECAR
jgi:hypothetical protein